MPAPYDVIVIGLGAMGGAAAHRLAARESRVLGLDRFGPLHDHGSSHGGSRIIRQAYAEDPVYVPLVLRAYELWEQIARDTGSDLLTVTGGVMVGPRDGELVPGAQRSAREWGLAHELLEPAELRRRFPAFRPRAEVGLYEPNAGLLRPEACVVAQLRLAARAGAELHFGEPVREWRASSAGVSVTTAAGAYHAERLVVAPGAWAPRLLADVGVPLEVERQVQYWFAPAGDAADFRADRSPIYMWEYESGQTLYGFPIHDGSGGGAKVAFHHTDETCDPDTVDRRVSPEEVERIREALRPRIPRLPHVLLRAKTCLYTNSPDRHFVIGPHPRHAEVVVACGFSGHGFKFAPMVGEIVADLALDGATRHPIARFAPTRTHAAAT